MGETINLKGGNRITIHIRVKYNTTVKMDLVEIISNATGNPASTNIFKSVDWKDVNGWLEMNHEITCTSDTYIRIRGKSLLPAKKWFYSNPIRIVNVGIDRNLSN